MTNSEGIVGKFIKQIRENRAHQNYEKAVGPERTYYAFDSDVRSYNADLEHVCPEGIDGVVVQKRAVLKRDPTMLVLLGQVGVMRELAVPGIAVALADDRPEETVRQDFENNRALVEGDVLLYKNTFGKVRKTMQKMGIGSIDLGLLRGVQGNLFLTDELPIQLKVLNEIIKLLNPDRGILLLDSFTRIPRKNIGIALANLPKYSRTDRRAL